MIIIYWSLSQADYPDVHNPAALPKLIGDPDDRNISATHTVLRSLSTHHGQYFSIEMGGEPAMNPNIIPHPAMNNSWILVAQLRKESEHFAELVCIAKFSHGVLACNDAASKLPIAPTFGDKCTGDLAYISLSQGPHDARVFYGPRQPYTVYGSNSAHTCFGQWVNDFRSLTEWHWEAVETSNDFSVATELLRPLPWSDIEKNWFLFWDIEGTMYIHHDLVPNRVFARLETSGSVGPDLGIFARAGDAECMKSYMPATAPQLESIHQATNSLSLTMCRRNDTSCLPSVANTFVFTIFHHKKYHNFHAVYEPYILVFEQVPPFKVYAISRKPFWIAGRQHRAPDETASTESVGDNRSVDSASRTSQQMLYVTSMSWKDKEQRYHGYLDDVLFIAFGIEDEATAAIDVLAGDLMLDLGHC